MEELKATIDKYEAQIAAIMAYIPANPYIVDLVARAINIAFENLPESTFTSRLVIVTKTAEFVGKNSNPSFFKHHIIMASILYGLDEEVYKSLDTPAKVLTEATTALTKVLCSEGCKDKWNALYKIGTTDEDLLAAALIALNADVVSLSSSYASRAPLAFEEKIRLIADGYIEVCLRNSKVTITNAVYPIYNEFVSNVLKAPF